MIKYVSAFKILWPPNESDTVERIFFWRLAVVVTAVSALLLVSAAMGWLPKIDGHAYAQDIDDKIASALEPVNTRLGSIETSQTAQGEYLKRLVKTDIAREIHSVKLAWCLTTEPTEKQRLRLRIDDLQDDYEEAAGKGKRATEPDCPQ